MKLQILIIKKLLRWLSVISLDSGLKKDENCYPQVFLRECNFNEKKSNQAY